ncbi:MAG TPA: HEAT repeat domain-containing protein [Archangium sp.]|nr:HEAT repeat domain-containing protein [Archangium sp.]
MLKDPDARVRQAAAFGLGELGGAASARLLEQQLAIEEARNDYDGESVVEEIVKALGRIEDTNVRTTLVRRLEKLTAGKPDPGDVYSLVHALWERRHKGLLPVIQRSLEQLPPGRYKSLQGLLVLLEKTPEELGSWALDPSVPVEHKTGVITVLEEELPGELLPTLTSFIATAHALIETAAGPRDERDPVAYYCECLASLLLRHRDRVLPALPEKECFELRELARKLIVVTAPNSSLRAAVLLQLIGQPEDATLIEAYRPAEPTLAKVFDDAAHVLRHHQKKE